MENDAMKNICESIIMQAVEDYRELKRRGVDKIYNNSEEKYCSLSELDTFFRSDWCNALLKANNIKIDGIAILRQLKSE